MTASRGNDAVLRGCTIVVAADRRSGDLASTLASHGARVLRAPAVAMRPNAEDELLIEHTRRIIARPPDIVVVTTGVGFRGWMDAAHENGLADDLTRALRRARFVARGPKAHGAIQEAGFSADWVARSETASEVGEYLVRSGVAGARVVVQHHGTGDDGLDALATTYGADALGITVYRCGPAPDPDLVARTAVQAATGGADAVLFTSARGAAEWLRLAERTGRLPLIGERASKGRLLIAAVGPNTAAPFVEAGIHTRVAARSRLGSLVHCVVDHYASGRHARLRTAEGVLEVRSGGALLDGGFIPLSRASADVLGALFDAGGNVLTREELSRVLPRPGRNSHAAEMAIARLREALGAPDLVKTVIKRGYRLAVSE
ncbi:uroporphyrinogen-III synthase [Microbacterium sp. NPDC057659]|uniref:uroporphyrinogen-III synthase n=1 Tax=Microbacterium sp. NPDC057659 TaxID=3346198 RepID=UPI00366BEA22